MSTSERIKRVKPVGGWLAGVAAAVVATLIAAWILADRPDPGEVPFKVAVEVYHSEADGWVAPVALSKLAPIPRPSGVDEQSQRAWYSQWVSWLGTHGAVPASVSSVQIHVQGTSGAQVTLTGLQVKVVNRRPAVQGTWAGITIGGDYWYRFVDADLDQEPPKLTAELHEEWESSVRPHERRPIRFPYKVSLSDAELFEVQARTERCDCEFVVELSWIFQDRSGTLTVDDKGKPFRVTGRANVTHTCYVPPPGMQPPSPPSCEEGKA